MTVRLACAMDAPAVAALMNHVIRDTTATFTTVEKTEAQVVQDIGDTPTCWVWEAAGEVKGYARYFPFRPGPGYAHVAEYSIAVAAAAQGQGAGRALLDALCDGASSAGISQIIGAVSSDNPAAIAFHSNAGFTQVGYVPDAGRKWGRSLDLILMQKRL